MKADSTAGPFQIIDIVAGSAAEERGLQGEDIILKINDLECEGMEESEFIQCIGNQQGSFSMTILREEEILYIPDLFLRKFHLPSVRGRFINNQGLAYIRISHFSEKTRRKWGRFCQGSFGSDRRVD